MNGSAHAPYRPLDSASGMLDDLPAEFNHAPVLDLGLWSLLGQFGAGKYMPDIEPAVYRVLDGGVFRWSERKPPAHDRTHLPVLRPVLRSAAAMTAWRSTSRV